MSLRDWGQFTRLPTASAEMGAFGLAAFLGGASLPWVFLAALFGILCHASGFAQNTLHDYLGGYDNEPEKAHFPLNSGRITVRQGETVTYGLIGAGLVAFLAFDPGTSPLPWAFLVVYVGTGFGYNLVGKRDAVGAMLLISTSFMFALLAMGSFTTGTPNLAVILLASYGFFYVAWQVGIGGAGKDITHARESNLLRRLGCRVGPGALGAASPTLAWIATAAAEGGGTVYGDTRPFLLTSRSAYVVSLVLSTAKALMLGAVAWEVAGPYWGILVAGAAWAVFAIYGRAFLKSGPFDRPRRMRLLGAGEAVGYVLMVVALIPVLWPWLWVMFIVLPVLWFVGMNRLLWPQSGSAFAPGFDVARIQIRFNTQWEQSDGRDYKWRLVVDGVERLAKDVSINVSCWTSEDNLPGGVRKWHITCEGVVTGSDGHLVISPLPKVG